MEQVAESPIVLLRLAVLLRYHPLVKMSTSAGVVRIRLPVLCLTEDSAAVGEAAGGSSPTFPAFDSCDFVGGLLAALEEKLSFTASSAAWDADLSVGSSESFRFFSSAVYSCKPKGV